MANGRRAGRRVWLVGRPACWSHNGRQTLLAGAIYYHYRIRSPARPRARARDPQASSLLTVLLLAKRIRVRSLLGGGGGCDGDRREKTRQKVFQKRRRRLATRKGSTTNSNNQSVCEPKTLHLASSLSLARPPRALFGLAWGLFSIAQTDFHLSCFARNVASEETARK